MDRILEIGLAKAEVRKQRGARLGRFFKTCTIRRFGTRKRGVMCQSVVSQLGKTFCVGCPGQNS